MTLSGARPSISSLAPISCPLIWSEHPQHPGCPSQASSFLGLLPVLADHSGQACWAPKQTGVPRHSQCPRVMDRPENTGGPETLRDEQKFVQEVQTEAVEGVWRTEAGLASGGTTTGKGQVRWVGSDTIQIESQCRK